MKTSKKLTFHVVDCSACKGHGRRKVWVDEYQAWTLDRCSTCGGRGERCQGSDGVFYCYGTQNQAAEEVVS